MKMQEETLRSTEWSVKAVMAVNLLEPMERERDKGERR